MADNNDYRKLRDEAVSLPAADRLQLIEALWDSLPEEAMPPLTEEWSAEIQRRSARYDAGEGESVPWERIRAEAMRRARGTNLDAAG